MNLKDILDKLNNSDIINNFEELFKMISNYQLIDYKDYIKYSEEKYNKVYLHTCDKYDLVLICWKNGQATQIHDHPDYCCILKVLEGCLFEEEYINNNNKIDLYNNNILKANSIANKKRDKILHRIIPLENSVSLHLYVPGSYKPKYYFEKN